MPERFELTWVAKSKQWRKRRTVNGKLKDFYLGTGKGKYDRASYAKALAKWREIAEGLEQAQRAEKAGQHYGAWQDSLASRPGVDPTIYYGGQHTLNKPIETISPSMQRWLDGTARIGEDRFGKPRTHSSTAATETLASKIDAYIESQQQRYKFGLRFPNAPQKDRISGTRFMTYRFNAGLIKAEWGAEPLPILEEATVSRLMNQFRDAQQRLLIDGKIGPGTVNERIKTMRHLTNWLFKKFVIPGLPRDKDELFAMHSVQTSARALSLDTIHQLWRGASLRFKAYIALGLNCGFYASDIAYLEHSHIQDGYIACNRHKTGVPMRIKLWDVTKRLLSSQCSGTGRQAFDSRKGGSLLIIDPMVGKHGRRWCEIESDVAAIKKRLKINPLSFSMFRDTSSTKVESIDRTVTDVFDGHADRRMARFYVDRSSLDKDQMFATLDRVTTKLESYYGLSLE